MQDRVVRMRCVRKIVDIFLEGRAGPALACEFSAAHWRPAGSAGGYRERLAAILAILGFRPHRISIEQSIRIVSDPLSVQVKPPIPAVVEKLKCEIVLSFTFGTIIGKSTT